MLIVGVFLGFQVNDWNEQRILDSQQEYYLERLKQNLETDSLQANNVIVENEQAMESVKYLVSVSRNPEVAGENPQMLPSSLFWPRGLRAVVSQRHTFDELRSNGRLGILGPPDLVEEVSRYYFIRAERDQFGVFNFESTKRYRKLQEGLLTLEQKMASYGFRDIEFPFPDFAMDREEAMRIGKKLSEKAELVDMLPDLYQDKFHTRREAVLAQQQIMRLITRINSQIESARQAN